MRTWIPLKLRKYVSRWLPALCLLAVTASVPPDAWCHCHIYYAGTPPNACDYIRRLESRTDVELVVFVGTLLDAIGSDKHGETARARVDEIVTGLPTGTREVTLEVSAILTGRSVPYAAGTRLVILGSRQNPFNGRVSFDFCGPHFGPGDTRRLDAVKAAASRKPPALYGRVTTTCGNASCRSTPGPETVLTARNGDVKHTAGIDPDGYFAFHNLVPGTWTIHAGGGKFTTAPNLPEELAVKITSGCEFADVALWPAGVLEGTVRDDAGVPVAGIPVQLDLSEVTREHPPDASAIHGGYVFVETRTDAEGKYRFQGLPPGEYLVGINISSEAEEQAWRPVYYPNTPRRIYATPLKLGMAETLRGIDLTLPPIRQNAKLIVEAVFEDGTPVPTFLGIVIDRVGRRRTSLELANESRGRPNPQSFGVFIGGTYRVECDHFVRRNPDVPNGPFDRYSGEVTGILMEEDSHRVRVVLRKKP